MQHDWLRYELLGRHRPQHSTVADFGVAGLRVAGGLITVRHVHWSTLLVSSSHGLSRCTASCLAPTRSRPACRHATAGGRPPGRRRALGGLWQAPVRRSHRLHAAQLRPRAQAPAGGTAAGGRAAGGRAAGARGRSAAGRRWRRGRRCASRGSGGAALARGGHPSRRRRAGPCGGHLLPPPVQLASLCGPRRLCGAGLQPPRV